MVITMSITRTKCYELDTIQLINAEYSNEGLCMEESINLQSNIFKAKWYCPDAINIECICGNEITVF